jgi:hypothetical protein
VVLSQVAVAVVHLLMQHQQEQVVQVVVGQVLFQEMELLEQ